MDGYPVFIKNLYLLSQWLVMDRGPQPVGKHRSSGTQFPHRIMSHLQSLVSPPPPRGYECSRESGRHRERLDSLGVSAKYVPIRCKFRQTAFKVFGFGLLVLQRKNMPDAFPFFDVKWPVWSLRFWLVAATQLGI